MTADLLKNLPFTVNWGDWMTNTVRNRTFLNIFLVMFITFGIIITVSYTSFSKNIKKIPTDLPVFFIWGSDDPVGSYGATIKKLIEIYKSNGMNKIDFKEYPGDRHEILNENDKETVENDIIEWLGKL